MANLTQMALLLQLVFGLVARRMAYQTGFCQRISTL